MIRPTILALVRHGESTWIAEGRFQGRGDPPLSELGRRQAAAVGARLAAPAEPPALPLPATAPLAIWHSPLRRAAETAQAIHEARKADAPLVELASLTELAQGAWEGLTHEEVRAHYPAELKAWRDAPLTSHAPGGESLGDAAHRAGETWRTILAGRTRPRAVEGGDAGPAEPVLGYERAIGDPASPAWTVVVAHDGILRLLLLDLLGLPLERFWSFPFGLAAVSVLDLGSGLPQLRAHNLDTRIKIPGARP